MASNFPSSPTTTTKCSECNFLLQVPILLPCGNSICQKHIITIDQDEKLLECRACGEYHSLGDLVIGDTSAASVSQFDIWCEKLRATMAELELLKNNPFAHISSTIGELKTQIYRKRDQLMHEIEQKSEQIISELDMYEIECKCSLDSTGGLVLERLKSEYETRKARVDKLMMSQEWEADILEQIERETRESTSTLGEIREFLLMNKLSEFTEKKEVFFQLNLRNSNGFDDEWMRQTEPQTSENMDSNFQIENDELNYEYEINEVHQSKAQINDQPASSNQLNPKSKKIESLLSRSNFNKNKEIMRLSEEKVEEVYNSGDKSLKNFSARLFSKYFNNDELVSQNYSVCGTGTSQMLDPIRMDFIKSHLIDRNGGPLSDKQWAECKHQISNHLVKRKKRYQNVILIF